MITSELDASIVRPLRSSGTIPYQRLSREFLQAAARYPSVLRSKSASTWENRYLYEFPGDLTHYQGDAR